MAYSAKAVPPGDIDGLTVDALASQEFTNEILCKFGTLLLQDVISVLAARHRNVTEPGDGKQSSPFGEPLPGEASSSEGRGSAETL